MFGIKYKTLVFGYGGKVYQYISVAKYKSHYWVYWAMLLENPEKVLHVVKRGIKFKLNFRSQVPF